MELFDVAIIGGWASGCVVAFLLAKNGKNVCVIDKNESLASKLLVTGNGRCNITNENMCSDFYNTNIDIFLNQFDNNSTKQFFADLGVEIYADDEGRCYPVSNTAKSVVFAINNALQNQNVTSFCGSEVLKVERQNLGYKITTQTNTINAKKIVFACGYNKNITNILNDLNIKHKNFTPSLVALKTKQSTKRLDGLRISGAKVTAVCQGIVKTQTGEVLFKKDGISGICVFNLSTLFSRKNNFDGKIAIDIFPSLSQDYLQNILQNSKSNYKTVFDLLLANLHKELALEVLRQAQIPQELPVQNLKCDDVKKIANTIKNLSFDVVGCYDNNQVFSGGIELCNLTNNLQSKTNNDIYFCGEICDADGECGGYNLQWAFSSANAVCSKFNKKS